MSNESDPLKELLRGKSTLLLQRERELFALGVARERIAAWLIAFHKLSLGGGSGSAHDWAQSMIEDLHFQVAAVFRREPNGAYLTLVSGQSHSTLPGSLELDSSALAFLEHNSAGVWGWPASDEPSPHFVDLAQNLRLGQFLWLRFSLGRQERLCIAGFSNSADSGSGMAHEDLSYFRMLGHHLAVLLRNSQLIAELNSDIDQRRKTQEELARSQQRQALLVEQSPLAVIEWSLDGKAVTWNPAAHRIFGYTAEEGVGLSWAMLTPGARMDQAVSDQHTVLDSYTRDGRRITCEWFHTGLRADEGERLIGFASLCWDITNRRQMENQLAESEAKFKSIFQAMQDGYLQADFDGKVTMVNPAALRLLGYQDFQELTSLDAVDLFDDQLEHATLTAALREGQWLSEQRARIRRKDGSVRVMEGGLRRVSGKTWEAVFRDITDRLRLEEERQARRSADAANQLKGQFLANMSHEIRTPLNAILGMTYLVLNTEMTGRQRDYLSKIQLAGKSLLSIVNDILDFSKVDAGRLELERLDLRLNEVLESLVATVANEAREKGLDFVISMDPDVPGRLVGDPVRLGQVLTNLVGNAIKFTEKGLVRLSVQLERTWGSKVELRFSVQDTGTGMTPQQLKGLFTAFTQADNSTTRKYGGTGLGLALCQRLVNLMQGEMAVESQPGEGSTFSFTAQLGTALPNRGAPARQQTDGSLVAAGGGLQEALQAVRGARVLLVEDNPINQQIARELLEDVGLKVETSNNGRLAVEKLLAAPGPTCPWDIVLMDLQMPEMDGYAATAVIRRDGRFPMLPILALTAHVLQHERSRCYEAGMDDFIAKPIDPEELISTIRRWIPEVPLIDIPQPPALDAFPPIAGIDIRQGLSRVAGNSQLYRTLLLDLAHQHDKIVSELSLAVEAEDLAQVRSLAHALNGVTGNLGVKAVQGKAAALERLADQGQVAEPALQEASHFRTSLHLLELSLKQISRRILETLDLFPSDGVTLSPPEVDVETTSELRKALAQLAEHLENSDGASLDLLEELLKLSPRGKLDHLAKLVRQFDFDAALAELRTKMLELESQIQVTGCLWSTTTLPGRT